MDDSKIALALFRVLLCVDRVITFFEVQPLRCVHAERGLYRTFNVGIDTVSRYRDPSPQ